MVNESSIGTYQKREYSVKHKYKANNSLTLASSIKHGEERVGGSGH